MRLWDIHPGYLNRQSLLGEHRELHAIVSIIVNKKKGYSRHPETLRWNGYGWALRQRHFLLAAEMALRGYRDMSPVNIRSKKKLWPEVFIDQPARQFKMLGSKYINRERGRIPLPDNAQQMWSHHKYSVLARDIMIYKEIGRKVAGMGKRDDFSDLAVQLVELLRKPPPSGNLRNALQHMWGYVSGYSPCHAEKTEDWPLRKLLKTIQCRAMRYSEPYLTASTALSELMAWLPEATE